MAEFPPPFDVQINDQVLTVDMGALFTQQEFDALEASRDPVTPVAHGVFRAARQAGIDITVDEAYATVHAAFVAMWERVTVDG